MREGNLIQRKTAAKVFCKEVLRRRRRMPGLLDICQDLFGSNDLYEILGVKKESTAKEGNANLIILTTF